MKAAQTAQDISPGLLKVMERAKDPNAQFNSLAHLIDEQALKRAFGRIRKKAAVGVDGITKEQYGQDLDDNIADLLTRMKASRYRHQSIRRVHIPKGKGKTRPIGISSIEDKIVQGAMREVLGAVYEQEFLPCSYGFRPKRSAHDAMRAVNQMTHSEGIGWILEADIESFFDSLDRTKLREMVGKRVMDGSMIRLIGKCLKVGVLDGEEFARPETGTAQGSILSPLLGNIYLHYVLDQWFDEEVRTRLQGHARLIRYADDFVIGFARRDDAERVLAVLHKRMAKFGLKLHPQKTRLIDFRRPPWGSTRAQTSSFDFLGFTLFWRRGRKGGWAPGMKTRRASIRKASTAISAYCRRQRHRPLKEQHAALSAKVQGHFQYFGVNGNFRSLGKVRHQVRRIWFIWLRRRSQKRTKLSWLRFDAYLKRFPLPSPRICVQIWQTP